MKRILTLLLIGLLIISSCNKKEITVAENQEKQVDSIETLVETDNNEEDNSEENEEIEEENLEEEIQEEANPSIEEEIEILEKNSDYISIVKMSQTGETGKEIHVLEDLKGSVKNIVLPDLPNIEANYSYLVFLMDSETGDITLTDIERGLIKIDGERDQYLTAIKELLYVPEEGN